MEDLGNSVRIAVTDSGLGIPAEAQAAIFEPFYRAANVTDGQARGMRLGLPICKALVEAHGGTIAVGSTVSSGSTFTVTLPYSAPAS